MLFMLYICKCLDLLIMAITSKKQFVTFYGKYPLISFSKSTFLEFTLYSITYKLATEIILIFKRINRYFFVIMLVLNKRLKR